MAALLWSGPLAVGVSIVACGVLLGYTLWLSYRARSAHPWCACTSSQAPVNLASIVRPLVMAVPVVGVTFVASSDTFLLEGGLAPPVVARGGQNCWLGRFLLVSDWV